MNQLQLIDKAQMDLEKANPKSEIRQYGIALLKTHHEHIRETHYLQYQNMIYQHAHKCYRQYKIDFDDLIAEGNYIYYKCFQQFIKKNYLCKFSTFLYNNLKSKLSFYCRRMLKRITINEEIEHLQITEQKNDFEKKVIFECSLSESSKKVVSLVLEHSDVFAFYLEGGKPTKDCLKNYLRDHGWKHNEIRNSFCEIKEALK